MGFSEEEAFQRSANVSRETLKRLVLYETLLKKWNPVINLVSRSTVADIWMRHFLDSAQLFDLAPENTGHWADIGSGGGFPGLVVAAIAAEKSPNMMVTLVESDRRKATFLQTAAREMDLQTQVLTERAENLPSLQADVISARALAPLVDLCELARHHLAPGGIALFPKGEKVENELKLALASWRFVVEKFPSKTEPNAVILKIGGLSRV